MVQYLRNVLTPPPKLNPAVYMGGDTTTKEYEGSSFSVVIPQQGSMEEALQSERVGHIVISNNWGGLKSTEGYYNAGRSIALLPPSGVDDIGLRQMLGQVVPANEMHDYPARDHQLRQHVEGLAKPRPEPIRNIHDVIQRVTQPAVQQSDPKIQYRPQVVRMPSDDHDLTRTVQALDDGGFLTDTSKKAIAAVMTEFNRVEAAGVGGKLDVDGLKKTLAALYPAENRGQSAKR